MSSSEVNVLLVDDDPEFLELLSGTLEGGGITCATARDGREALESYAKLHPAVVIVDVSMPELDGYQLCQRLRQDNNDVKIVFCSAHGKTLDRMTGLRLGADDFIVKPIESWELLYKVRRMLVGSEAKPAQVAADPPGSEGSPGEQ